MKAPLGLRKGLSNAALAAATATALSTANPARGQSTLNLEIQCTAAGLSQQSASGYTVVENSPIEIFLMGIDPSKNWSSTGESYAAIQTTDGIVYTATNDFYFGAVTSGTHAQFGYDWTGPEMNQFYGYIDVAMPAGFSFNTLADYQQFFDTANRNGLMYPLGTDILFADDVEALPNSFTISTIPEPSSTKLALAGAGGVAALTLARWRKQSKSVQGLGK